MRDRGVASEDFAGTRDGIADFGPVRATWFSDTREPHHLIDDNSPLRTS